MATLGVTFAVEPPEGVLKDVFIRGAR